MLKTMLVLRTLTITVTVSFGAPSGYHLLTLVLIVWLFSDLWRLIMIRELCSWFVLLNDPTSLIFNQTELSNLDVSKRIIFRCRHCVTRAPLLYFIRSWVALSFKAVSQSVSQSAICNTCADLHFLQYIKAWRSSRSVLYWPSSQLHHLVTHSWADWI